MIPARQTSMARRGGGRWAVAWARSGRGGLCAGSVCLPLPMRAVVIVGDFLGLLTCYAGLGIGLARAAIGQDRTFSKPRKTMLRPKIAVVSCMLCLSSSGWSSGDDDLWILPAAVACIAQYPELSSTHLGTIIVKAPQFQRHIDRAKAAFATDPWAGGALCDELMHDKPDPRRDDRAHFNNMRDRHRNALKALAGRFPDGWSFSKPP